MKSWGAGLQLTPPVILDTADDSLVVEEGQDELSDGNEDISETENSVDNPEEDNACTSADRESSTEPSHSRSTTPANSTGINPLLTIVK